MRIAVVGAGALGLYYGAVLQKAGNDIHFILRRDFDAVVANGLKVFSVNGDFHLPHIKGYRTAEEIGEVDLVLIGLKTFANHRYSELVSPLLGKNTLILTLQNGLGNEETLASLFGEDRILGGVAFLCSNRGIPGVVHHLGEGRIILGEFTRTGTARADKISAMFMEAGVDCKAVPDLKRARWDKLVWNIPFNGLCALMLKPVDELLSLAATRKLIIDMMGEVIAGGNAQGLMKDMPGSLAEKMVTFSENLGSYKPSMMIDRMEGRSLELDAIFGVPLVAAAKQGVSMPRVEELHALLQLVEKG